VTAAMGATSACIDAEVKTLRSENDHLRGVLCRRAVIEQAKGALVLRYGLDDDAAFALLRRWSQTRNVKVHIVADTLVNVVCRGAPPPPGADELAEWLREQIHRPALEPVATATCGLRRHYRG
jgi:hypothetical protein